MAKSSNVAKVKPASPKSAPTRTKIHAGKDSGKRTLVDAMDDDIAAKRARKAPAVVSKFFGGDAHGIADSPVATKHFHDGKENCIVDVIAIDDEDGLEGLGTNCKAEEVPDPVTQEDGYISPSSNVSRNITPDLSSPDYHHRSRRTSHDSDELQDTTYDMEDIFDILSSPVLSTVPRIQNAMRTQEILSQDIQEERKTHILVRDSSEPEARNFGEEAEDNVFLGPDLQFNFEDEIDDDETVSGKGNKHTHERATSVGKSTKKLNLSLLTSHGNTSHSSIIVPDSPDDIIGTDDYIDELELWSPAVEKISQGWKSRFSFGTQPQDQSSAASSKERIKVGP